MWRRVEGGGVRLSRQRMVSLAWWQIALSLLSIPAFVLPFPLGWKVALLGVLSALTWTGTGLGNLAAAWAARDLEKSE